MRRRPAGLPDIPDGMQHIISVWRSSDVARFERYAEEVEWFPSFGWGTTIGDVAVFWSGLGWTEVPE